VIISIKKHITILKHKHFEEHNIQVILAKVIAHELHIAIVNIYATPCENLTNIMDFITKTISTLYLNEIIIVT
jgi:hypothetical protein